MPKIPVLVPTLTWQQHWQQWQGCKLCDLCNQRDRIVLARGDIPSDILFVGEAPGDSEDVVGQPFKGPAGELLDQIIDRVPGPDGWAVTLRWSFTNLVACYPREAKRAGFNEPEGEEIEACAPRLKQFVQLARPKLLVAVGSLADAWLPQCLDFMVYAGGRVERHATIQQMVSIVHPAAILRMPQAQKGMAAHRASITLSNAIELVWG